LLWWFSIDESEIQDVAAPKDADQHPLTNSICLPSVNCNGQEIDMSAFPIQQPHPENLHLVCCLIEHSLLPHINHVIDHHEHMFVTHNVLTYFVKVTWMIYWHSFYFITLSLQL
jgi:hypothetical protein